MANNIKGITIEIGGDTTKLSEALKDTNTKIKSTQSELNEVKKLLKLDPKNTELLAQKQQILKNAVSETKEKLDVLKDAEKQVQEQFKNGQASEEQYRAIKREIEATAMSLEKLQDAANEGKSSLEKVGDAFGKAGEKTEELGNKLLPVTAGVTAIGGAGIAAAMELDNGYDTIITKTGATGEALDELNAVADNIFANMPTDMDKAGIAVGEVNTRFGATGETLKNLSEDFIRFSEINETDLNNSIGKTDKLMEQWNISTSQTGNLLGLITKKCQETGISADTLMDSLQKNGATFKEMGLNIVQSTNLLAQFEANGVNADTAIAGLRKSIKIYTDDGKSVEEALKLTIDSIKNASNETEALAIAQETFGTKGAAEMSNAIREGRIDIESLSASMSAYGSTVEDTFNATLDPWDDATVAMNNVKLAGADLGNTLLSALQPTITKVVDKVKEFTEWFRGLSQGQKEAIIKIAALVAAIGPALIAFGKLSSGISGAIGVITKLKIGLSAGGGLSGILSALTGPVGIALAALAALTAGFVGLYNTNDEFREQVNSTVEELKTAFSAMWENIQPALESLKEAFSTLLTSLQPIFEILMDFVGGLINGVMTALPDFTAAISNAVQFISDIVGMVIALITGDNDALFEHLTSAISSGLSFIQSIIDGFVNLIVGFFDFFGVDIKAVFSGIWDKIVEVFGSVGEWFSEKFTEAKEGIASVFGAIGEWFSARWEDIKAAFALVGSWFLEKFTESYNNIVSVFAAIGSWFAERWNDITTALANIASWFHEMFTNAYTNLTNVFKAIGSWFSARWNDITSALANVASWFLTMFTNAYSNLTNVFKDIGSWFSARWNDITSAFSSVASWFGEMFTNAWENIKSAFSNVTGFFSELWEKIKGCFVDVGTKIGDAVGGAFKSGINTCLSTIEGIVNKFIGMINGVIGIINEIPGVSLGQISEISLPRLAKGGALREGQAIFAEAGPELLSMVNGKAVVTPLTSSARNHSLEQLKGSSQNYEQNINIYSNKALSPYEVARQTRIQTRQMVLALQRG